MQISSSQKSSISSTIHKTVTQVFKWSIIVTLEAIKAISAVIKSMLSMVTGK